MSSSTFFEVPNAKISNAVLENCRDLVEGFSIFTTSSPIELVEDSLRTVNRLLSSRYPAVKVAIDRYAPAFRSGALRLTKGAYVAGMSLFWTEDTVYMNDGDFIARFDQDEANRAALAHETLAYALAFIDAHL